MRRPAIALLGAALVVGACTTDDPPTLETDPSAPRVSSDTLPECPATGPDATTPGAGCVDDGGRVLRP